MAMAWLCHFFSYVMYISGAKFKEYCFNTSRDILDRVLCCFNEANYDIITFLNYEIQKHKSKTKKDIPKKRNAILYFEKPFK